MCVIKQTSAIYSHFNKKDAECCRSHGRISLYKMWTGVRLVDVREIFGDDSIFKVSTYRGGKNSPFP